MPAGRLRRARPGRADARRPGRRVRVVEVETPRRRRSPGRCCSATSRRSCTRATRRWPSAGPQALSLDPTLLAELLGRAELRELLDPTALAEIEAELQRLARAPAAARRRGRRRPAARLLGDLTDGRGRGARGVADGLAGRAGRRPPRASGSGSPARSAGSRSRTPAGSATRSGTALPVGVPEAFLEPVADPLGDLVARYARTHGPFAARRPRRPASAWASPWSTGALSGWPATGRLVAGEFRPGGAGHGVVRRRGAALAAAAVAGRAAPGDRAGPAAALARFLPAWQQRRLAGARRRRRAARRSSSCRARRCRPRRWSAGAAGPGRRLLPRAARRAVARRRGAVGRRRRAARRRRLGHACPRRHAPRCCCPADDERRADAAARGGAGRARPAAQALFFRRCATGSAPPTTPALAAAIWDLVWAGR